MKHQIKVPMGSWAELMKSLSTGQYFTGPGRTYTGGDILEFSVVNQESAVATFRVVALKSLFVQPEIGPAVPCICLYVKPVKGQKEGSE
jgi:hypothetical protein